MHVFPNNKVYIGITSQDPPEKRWLNGFGYKDQIRVWRAIQKYGWNNIQHIIVARQLNICSATNMEKELIELYNATDVKCGYNVSVGGWAMSEDSKMKLSKYRTGKHLSEKAKQKLSDKLKYRKPSKLAIEWIRKYNSNRDYSKMVQPNERPILQFDVITARLVGEYKSINCGAKEYELDPRNIKCCADENVCQYKGYVWIYKDKANEEYIARRLFEAQNPQRFFPVSICDINDSDHIEYYSSQKELCEQKCFSYKVISRVINNKSIYRGTYMINKISIPEYVYATGKQYY